MSDSEEEYTPTPHAPSTVTEKPPGEQTKSVAPVTARAGMAMLSLECKGEVVSVGMSDGLVAAGSTTGYLSLWNCTENKGEPSVNVVPFPAPDRDHPPISCVSTSPCSTFAVVAQSGSSFRVVKANGDLGGPSPQGEATFLDPTKCKGHKGVVTALCFVPQTTCLVSGARDSTVRCWDPERVRFGPTSSFYHGSDLGGGEVYCVSGMSRTCFLSGGSDRIVRLWDTRERYAIGKCALSFELPSGESVGGITSAGTSVVARCQSGRVFEVSLRNPTSPSVLAQFGASSQDALPIGFRHRGKQLWLNTSAEIASFIYVSGCWVSGKPIPGHASSLCVAEAGVAFGTKGRLVVASDDGSPEITKWMTAVDMEPRTKSGRRIE